MEIARLSGAPLIPIPGPAYRVDNEFSFLISDPEWMNISDSFPNEFSFYVQVVHTMGPDTMLFSINRNSTDEFLVYTTGVQSPTTFTITLNVKLPGVDLISVPFPSETDSSTLNTIGFGLSNGLFSVYSNCTLISQTTLSSPPNPLPLLQSDGSISEGTLGGTVMFEVRKLVWVVQAR